MAGFPHLLRSDPTGARREKPRAGSSASKLGMRRVSWVLIDMRHGRPRCLVEGVGHRLPVRRRVPLSTAAALIAAGIPYTIHTGTARNAAPAAHASGRGDSRRGERV